MPPATRHTEVEELIERLTVIKGDDHRHRHTARTQFAALLSLIPATVEVAR